MGKTVYISDKVVAASFFIHPGEWVWIPNDVEADFLLDNKHAYATMGKPPPAPYYVDPLAPLPYVAWAPPAPSPPPPPPVPPPGVRTARLPQQQQPLADDEAGS